MFLGIWPSEQERAALQAHAQQWQWPQTARRSAPERLHMTLHFLGDVPPSQLPQLQATLDVQREPCTVLLDRAEVWPGGIAVLEALQVPPALARLHERLAAALRAQGLPVEGRRFRPHATLARKAQGARPPAGFAPLRWELVGGYLLVRSMPGGRGYVPVQAFG
jgi:2'-5' RNA ligase